MDKELFLLQFGLRQCYGNTKPSNIEECYGFSRKVIEVNEESFEVLIETPLTDIVVVYEKEGDKFSFKEVY
ncbi:hypothetical protein BKK51_07275 [Rodentibacter trehalosifermentans]|uniref:Uncharacterized protein n=1 Tax=Rodentibacter trehalosifermentans TaxID=1908263 RepID=A0A1V3J2H2_9PAST|nr:hypothetical protein [Rodentibacter trehalosifermentans]OOF45155.1 hypothetical protein BKK51_07275 [Rodentibacter trehalosifermentans]OOF48914.1 hypothetical protein BKK52_04935 [Rodentibacter trehalosifermentans]